MRLNRYEEIEELSPGARQFLLSWLATITKEDVWESAMRDAHRFQDGENSMPTIPPRAAGAPSEKPDGSR